MSNFEKTIYENMYLFTHNEKEIIYQCVLYIAKGAWPRDLSRPLLVNHKKKLAILFDNQCRPTIGSSQPLCLNKQDLLLIKLCIEETLDHEEFVVFTSLPEKAGHDLIQKISNELDK